MDRRPKRVYEAYANQQSILQQREGEKGLVEYCRNEWLNDPDYDFSEVSSLSSDEEDDFPSRLDRFLQRSNNIVSSPKFRKYLVLANLTVFLLILFWTKFWGPWLWEQRAVWNVLNPDTALAAGGLFGTNVRPKFPGMIQVGHLDPKYLPQSASSKHDGKRLIFVGDIHGCSDEFTKLLEKVNYNSKNDHVIALGDMIEKGPDSAGVVDMLRNMKASCVRGNNDDRILLLAEEAKSPSLRSQNDGFGIADETLKGQTSSSHKGLAASLSHDQLSYLRSCPLILSIGAMKAFKGNVVAVHAGLVPGVPLKNQDPSAVMNMRILDLVNFVPSKAKESEGSVPWFKLWNKYQKMLITQKTLADNEESLTSVGPHTTVIYGHDARKGLQIEKYTKGLDSACVRGGKLTALVLGEGGSEEIVQVNCKDYIKK